MSGEQGEESREHEPTQRKLDEARKKGDIPRMADLTTAMSYGGFLLASAVFGPGAMLAMGGLLALPLDHAAQMDVALFGGGGPEGRAARLSGELITGTFARLLPWIVIPMALTLVPLIAFRGIVFAPKRIQPKGERISLLSGFKNKFGRAGLFEFAKSAVKLTIYGTILFLYLWAELPRIVSTLTLPPSQIAAEMGRTILRLMSLVLIVALVIGVIDLLFQRAEHIRKNRMSRKELRDEMKESEGDPTLKQKRREKGQAIAMNQMLVEVPKADVVVVNPTHYAVALKWKRTKGGAPECIAKGVDAVALRIRAIAMENGVPIHSDPPTARALHAGMEIGDEVPVEHFRAVAAAIRFADRIRRKARG